MNRFSIILILFLLAFLGGIFFIAPRDKDLNLLKEKIQQKTIELDSKEDYFSDIHQLDQKIKNYQASLLKVESAIPDEPGVPSLLEFFKKSASQSGLVLKRFDVISVGVSSQNESFSNVGEDLGEKNSFNLTPSTYLKETSFNLNLSGYYSSFRNFLSVLENSARLVEVESIIVTAQEELVDVQIRLKVYSL